MVYSLFLTNYSKLASCLLDSVQLGNHKQDFRTNIVGIPGSLKTQLYLKTTPSDIEPKTFYTPMILAEKTRYWTPLRSSCSLWFAQEMAQPYGFLTLVFWLSGVGTK